MECFRFDLSFHGDVVDRQRSTQNQVTQPSAR
ncbi:Uncharacterised protein [Vibrio cholerae]|nr:Uncharacterised protein [Vibrio cholerae]